MATTAAPAPAREALASLFRPRNVALVGASDRSAWSHMIFHQFMEYGHRGNLFAVNRSGTAAHGLPGHTSVAAIPDQVDTAYIFLPAPAVSEALREAAAAGVKNAVVLSSGFSETGAEGEALERELAQVAAETGVTMLGPNSLGFANFTAEAFCTAMRCRQPLRPGGLALVSQSGAICVELAKWAHAQGIGLGFLCSTGNEAQVSMADILDYLVDDPSTTSIGLYLEGISDPERFEAVALRALAKRKPIVALKTGRSAQSKAVVLAHTGADAGDDEAFEALCRRTGISRAASNEELVSTAHFLGNHGPIDPPRVGMASVSGGACCIYADLAHIHGLALEDWAPATQAALRQVLPSFAGTLNPLDVTGVTMQNPPLWTETIPILARDPGMGAVVVGHNIPITPIDLEMLERTFEAIGDGFRVAGITPIVVSFSLLDYSEIEEAVQREHGLASVLPDLDLGVRALAHLQRWSERILAG